MKFLSCIFFSLLTAGVFAQQRDTIYADSSKKLVIKDAELPANRSLILIDEVVYIGLLKDIDTKTIVSIDVLKPKDATEIYGEPGKNGVILIRTNKAGSVGQGFTAPVENEILPLNPDKKSLIVMDGIIYTGKFNDIDPKDILSLDTLGNPAATNIYGEQGKNGVVLITTLSQGKAYCQRKLSNFSIAYSIYMAANKNDDSGLVYILDGVVLDGPPSAIIKKLYHKIEKLQTVIFIEKSSKQLDTNKEKPMLVITTVQR